MSQGNRWCDPFLCGTRSQPVSIEQPEVSRLEGLWQGDFGDAYVDRNIDAGGNRGQFWHDVLNRFPAPRVLEVGCNIGANLRWIAEKIPPQAVYGVDINIKALDILHQRHPAVNALYSPARELPFRDRWFDFVFTMGVLIHQPDSTLPLVMAEIVRCSSRFIFCGEYFAETPTEVFYREQYGALIKRDFGRIYQELFPQLALREKGFLSRAEGWDDVTYWVFEKTF
jgi:pseudaminic acid biosynthesis-associated methylase